MGTESRVNKHSEMFNTKGLFTMNRICSNLLRPTDCGLNGRASAVVVKGRVDFVEKVPGTSKIFWARGNRKGSKCNIARKSPRCWVERDVMHLTKINVIASSSGVPANCWPFERMRLQMRNLSIKIIEFQGRTSWANAQSVQKHSLHRASRSSRGGEKRQTLSEGNCWWNSSIMSRDRRSALIFSLPAMWRIRRSMPVSSKIPARASRTEIWIDSEARRELYAATESRLSVHKRSFCWIIEIIMWLAYVHSFIYSMFFLSAHLSVVRITEIHLLF